MAMGNGVKKNIAYNFIYQILVLILPFITAPYLARTIGAYGVGTFSFAQSIVSYFSLLVMLGLQNYGNRSIAAVQNDKAGRSKVFWEIYAMQAGMFVLSAILYSLYNVFFAIDLKASILMSFWLFSSFFDVNWFLFGMEQFKLIVIRNMIVKITTVFCIFFFVKNETDVYVYVLIMALGTLISQISLWPFVLKVVSVQRISLNGILSHVRPNIVLFIPVLAASVYNIMDKIMLGYMTDMREVGFYENAEKIIKMVQSLIVAIGTVMLPRVTALFSIKKDSLSEKYFDIAIECVLAYVCVAIFGIFSIKDVFVDIYFGNGFERTGFLLGLLIITIFFFGIGNVLRTQFLIPKKYDGIFVKSAIGGALLNLFANIVLIPRYAAAGAAVSTIFAEGFVCCYQFFKVRNEIKIGKYFAPFLKYAFLSALMFAFTLLIPNKENNVFVFIGRTVIIVVFSLVVGCCVYKKIKKSNSAN